ncbi:hypothetical protein BSKO_05348 [Bryopsis sp. KO-2023]|nr:hypothetical protein BSKO_05348 [Bryopsis sp. KO-2023]
MVEENQYMALDFERKPRTIYSFRNEYRESSCPTSNFLKGVKWAPDGSCLLTASEDKMMRIFTFPTEVFDQRSTSGDKASGEEAVDPFDPICRIQEGELVYDYAWYPCMSSQNAQTCCFLSTCRKNPIHLWDACSGNLRATYRAYDQADEITAAISVGFSNDGACICAGYKQVIRVFDTARPGRDYDEFKTHSKNQLGQQGLISCLAWSPSDKKLLAAGSYNGSVGMYASDDGELLALLEGHTGGVTQVKFSVDGNYLYSGARKDSQLICWDIRHTKMAVYVMERGTSITNQRIQFDIEPCGRHLVTGGEQGRLDVFDLTTGEKLSGDVIGEDAVNGVMFHPFAPLMATASGERRFVPLDLDKLEDISEGHEQKSSLGFPLGPTDNTLRIWLLSSRWMSYEPALQEEQQPEVES